MNSIAMLMARLQVLQKLEDLRLHGDVEGGRRLVGDEKIGPVGERHGDHHPLALAAGELMRKGAKPLAGIGNADFPQQLDDAGLDLFGSPRAMQLQVFRRFASRSCASGLSEVIGSWKTMVMWAPLISRSRASRAASKSSPSKSAWP